MQEAETAARQALRGGPVEQLPHVAAWRDTYRAFGDRNEPATAWRPCCAGRRTGCRG